MTISPEQTRNAIAQVCHADSLAESLIRFNQYETALQDCKFVFASSDGNTPGLATHRDFEAGAAVRSLFATQTVVVIDRNTVADMRSGSATFGFDYSISLDTQALSYLLPYLNSNTSKLPKDYESVFAFIAHPDTNVDPTPYRLENLFNLTKRPAEDHRIYERMRGYEILRTLDATSLANGNPRSTLSDAELTKRTQEQMASMYSWIDTPHLMDSTRFKHGTMYCLLLKMCTLQLAKPRASAMEKLVEFCDFCDKSLATMYARETLIARRYFERGRSLGFFSKIMIEGKEQIERLHAMAWDLWHVRWLEKAITLNVSPHARYFFPALLTFDKGLIEILDLYPLRACAYSEASGEPYAVFDGDWLTDIAGDSVAGHAFVDRFYSDQAIARRETIRDEMRPGLYRLIDALETEFRQVARI